MNYIKPQILVQLVSTELLLGSEPLALGATDIGSPSVRYNSKSIWDEVNETYNINKEEQEDENWN